MLPPRRRNNGRRAVNATLHESLPDGTRDVNSRKPSLMEDCLPPRRSPESGGRVPRLTIGNMHDARSPRRLASDAKDVRMFSERR